METTTYADLEKVSAKASSKFLAQRERTLKAFVTRLNKSLPEWVQYDTESAHPQVEFPQEARVRYYSWAPFEGAEDIAHKDMVAGRVYVQRDESDDRWRSRTVLVRVTKVSGARVYYQDVSIEALAGISSERDYTQYTLGKSGVDYYDTGLEWADLVSAAEQAKAEMTKSYAAFARAKEANEAAFDAAREEQKRVSDAGEAYLEPLNSALGSKTFYYNTWDGDATLCKSGSRSNATMLYRIVARYAMGFIDQETAQRALELLIEVSHEDLRFERNHMPIEDDLANAARKAVAS